MQKLGGVIAGLVFLAACGGGTRNADTTSAAAGAPAAGQPAAGSSASAGGAAAGGAAAGGGTAAAQPATGKTWNVQMVGDASGYKFVPATLTIKQGDAVKWTVVSGPPHNVSFYPDSIPPGAQNQLQANMPNTMSPLTSPLFNNPNDTYTVSFAGVPKGTYKYFCTPHQALGMHAQLTVQ